MQAASRKLQALRHRFRLLIPLQLDLTNTSMHDRILVHDMFHAGNIQQRHTTQQPVQPTCCTWRPALYPRSTTKEPRRMHVGRCTIIYNTMGKSIEALHACSARRTAVRNAGKSEGSGKQAISHACSLISVLQARAAIPLEAFKITRRVPAYICSKECSSSCAVRPS